MRKKVNLGRAQQLINANKWEDGTVLLLPGQDPYITALIMRNVIRATIKQEGVKKCLEISKFMLESQNVKTFPEALGAAAYKMAFFEPDIKHQTIKTPNATMREKRANCVAYTVLICAAALNVIDDVSFCLVDLGSGNYDHVYPIICGVAVDVVPCQDQSGNEIFVRKPLNIPKYTTFDVARAQIFEV